MGNIHHTIPSAKGSQKTLALFNFLWNLEGKEFNIQGKDPSCECRNGGTCLYTWDSELSKWPKRITLRTCFCNEISEGIFASSGRTCQKLEDFCKPNACVRGGQCVNKMGYHFCVNCQTGWGGQNCTRQQTRTRTWTEDFTAVWYPNSDFQVTSISWIRLSYAQTGGRHPIVYLEYFGLLIRTIDDFRSDPNFLKDCYDMESERVACDTYRKGVNYYSMVWKAHNSFLAAPYNLIFGAELENALTVNSPLFPNKMYAVKYEVKLHVYSNNELLMPVTPLKIWHQVTSTYSACLPMISFDGCSTSVKYPEMWHVHELVSLQLISRRQKNSICKNLVVEFRDAVTFFSYHPGNQTRATRPPRKNTITTTLNNIDWQDDVELTFVQRKRYFFGVDTFWIATFPLRLFGSYVSSAGRDLYMELNAMCFFRTATPRTIVTVEGGDRIVDCMHEVEFQPVSSDPSFDLNLFILRWSCVDETNAANPDCKPRITRWGPYTYKTLACNKVLKFKMEPFHEYYKMTSPSGRNSGKPYEWTITTEIGSTEIKVLCKTQCDKVNPMNEILVEAIERPITASGPPDWTLFEGGVNGTALQLNDYTSSTGNPWVISLNRNTLKIATTYLIEARTTRGKGSRKFATNSPPENGTCSISPGFGIKGLTMFNVTCENWEDEDLPILYTFGTTQDMLFEPLVSSYYADNLLPTVLFDENVSVCVTDVYNMRTVFPLKVKLTNSDKAYNFADQLNEVADEYLNRNYAGMVNWIVENSKVSTAIPEFPALWKVEIFKNILKVMPHVTNFLSIDKIVGSILRLTKGSENGNVIYDEDGDQDMVIGQGLELAAERFKEQCSQEEGWYTMWDSQIHGIISVIMATADAAFKAYDPTLMKSSNASEGTQEIHRQKAKFGVWYTMKALQIIMGIARSTAVPDQSPYMVKNGGITLFTAVGRPKTLQGYLLDFGSDGSTLVLSSNTICRMGISTYAVEVIRTDNYAYHSWKPIVGQVLHIRFLKGSPNSLSVREAEFEEYEMSRGPYELNINVGSDLKSVDIKGVVHWPSTLDLPERVLNRYVAIYQFKLPTGFCGVIVRLNNEDIGKLKIFMAQGILPTYFEVSRQSPVDKLWYEAKVLNQNPRLSSDFYIGFISNKQGAYNYEAKVTIVRCVSYISDAWEAQKCKYMHLIEDGGSYTAKCVCYHLSNISADVVVPDPSLRIMEDIYLFVNILDNWYVAAVMFLILMSYFGLLVWGKFKDFQDDKAQIVHFLRDNFPGDMHPYIVGVWTGKRCTSGTSSKVAIRIFGARARSRPHILRSPLRSVLNMGEDDWFLLYTPKPLGEIQTIILWHNSGGCSGDWYCSQVTVFDMKADMPYNFLVERWFTISEDMDESKMWIGDRCKKGVFVREPSRHSTFQLMSDHFFAGIREKHRWTCIFTRHPRSRTSRCERIAVLATMIIVTMMTGIIFFGTGDFGARDLPFGYMSLTDLEATLKSMLSGIVLSYIILRTFDKANHKPKTEEMIENEQEIAEEVKKMKKVHKKRTSRWIWKWYIKTKRRLGMTLQPLIDEATYRENKKKEKFNFWLLAAWIVVTITLLFMSFIVVLYGLRFGKKRSTLWIQGFLSGTLFDAFFIEPIRMVISAYWVAIVFKRSSVGDVIIKVAFDQKVLPFQNFMERLNKMWRRTQKEYNPMTYKRIMKLYRHRSRMAVFRRYVLYMIILTIAGVCAILGILALEVNSVYFSNRMILEQMTASRTTTSPDARKIVTLEQLTNFTLQTVLTAIHRTRWYNGQAMKHERNEPVDSDLSKVESQRKGWFIDCSSKLLGAPRARQQRLAHNPLARRKVSQFFKKYTKPGPLMRYFREPLGSLYLYNEDYSTYLVGWKDYNYDEVGNISNLWQHRMIHFTETDYYTGETGGTYPGHGYVEMLYWTRGGSEIRYNQLIMNEWLDNRTRVFFLELDLYNANSNTFTSFVLLAERLPANIYVVKPLIDTATLIYHQGLSEILSLSTSLLLTFCLILYTTYFVNESARIGFVHAAKSWRGFIDFSIIILGITQVALNITRTIRFYALPDRLDKTPHDSFIALYAPMFNNFKVQFFLCVFGLLVMIANTTAVHDLTGVHNIQWVLHKNISVVSFSLILNFMLFVLIRRQLWMDSYNTYNYLLFDVLFNDIHVRDYSSMVMPVEITLAVCFPISICLSKFILSGAICFRDVAEEMITETQEMGGKRKWYQLDLKDPTHEAYRKRIRKRVQSINKKFNLILAPTTKEAQKANKEGKAREKEEKIAERELKKLAMYEEPEGDMWADWAKLDEMNAKRRAERKAAERRRKKREEKMKRKTETGDDIVHEPWEKPTDETEGPSRKRKRKKGEEDANEADTSEGDGDPTSSRKKKKKKKKKKDDEVTDDEADLSQKDKTIKDEEKAKKSVTDVKDEDDKKATKKREEDEVEPSKGKKKKDDDKQKKDEADVKDEDKASKVPQEGEAGKSKKDKAKKDEDDLKKDDAGSKVKDEAKTAKEPPEEDAGKSKKDKTKKDEDKSKKDDDDTKVKDDAKVAKEPQVEDANKSKKDKAKKDEGDQKKDDAGIKVKDDGKTAKEPPEEDAGKSKKDKKKKDEDKSKKDDDDTKVKDDAKVAKEPQVEDANKSKKDKMKQDEDKSKKGDADTTVKGEPKAAKEPPEEEAVKSKKDKTKKDEDKSKKGDADTTVKDGSKAVKEPPEDDTGKSKKDKTKKDEDKSKKGEADKKLKDDAKATKEPSEDDAGKSKKDKTKKDEDKSKKGDISTKVKDDAMAAKDPPEKDAGKSKKDKTKEDKDKSKKGDDDTKVKGDAMAAKEPPEKDAGKSKKDKTKEDKDEQKKGEADIKTKDEGKAAKDAPKKDDSGPKGKDDAVKKPSEVDEGQSKKDKETKDEAGTNVKDDVKGAKEPSKKEEEKLKKSEGTKVKDDGKTSEKPPESEAGQSKKDKKKKDEDKMKKDESGTNVKDDVKGAKEPLKKDADKLKKGDAGTKVKDDGKTAEKPPENEAGQSKKDKKKKDEDKMKKDESGTNVKDDVKGAKEPQKKDADKLKKGDAGTKVKDDGKTAEKPPENEAGQSKKDKKKKDEDKMKKDESGTNVKDDVKGAKEPSKKDEDKPKKSETGSKVKDDGKASEKPPEGEAGQSKKDKKKKDEDKTKKDESGTNVKDDVKGAKEPLKKDADKLKKGDSGTKVKDDGKASEKPPEGEAGQSKKDKKKKDEDKMKKDESGTNVKDDIKGAKELKKGDAGTKAKDDGKAAEKPPGGEAAQSKKDKKKKDEDKMKKDESGTNVKGDVKGAKEPLKKDEDKLKKGDAGTKVKDDGKTSEKPPEDEAGQSKKDKKQKDEDKTKKDESGANIKDDVKGAKEPLKKDEDKPKKSETGSKVKDDGKTAEKLPEDEVAQSKKDNKKKEEDKVKKDEPGTNVKDDVKGAKEPLKKDEDKPKKSETGSKVKDDAKVDKKLPEDEGGLSQKGKK